MKIDCNFVVFCPKTLTIPAGQMLADAVREAGWKHTRLPGGKSTNVCPLHSSGRTTRVGDWGGD